MALGFLRSFIQRLQPSHFTSIEVFDSRSAVPETMGRGVMAVVGTPARPKWVYFRCPCGQHIVLLSLQASHDPHWRLELGRGGATIFPSVRLTADPYCHFSVRRGRVIWHPKRFWAGRRRA